MYLLSRWGKRRRNNPETTMELQLYNVAPRIPDELKFLETLSNNIWWCWHPLAIELFVRINPNLWREVSGSVSDGVMKRRHLCCCRH